MLSSYWKKRLAVLGVGALLVMCVFVLLPAPLAHASVETSLIGLKSKLTGVILPLLSVIGLALSAFSFFSGNPQAKQHVAYAIIGCVLGFGAQAIVDMIASTVR
jgi:type IV secretory pathway VirB2 component (pilin)